ncbi:STAS domain-containing protein [Halalkalibacterium ligniniphilum]|uniref:STAS domain-containing protein n=1 Tax=Halalkalibacterium ligniniphilum TaxID=1134413 RepID=UPI000349E9FA|nr:STAS domain-containing protein [Halalkalibacterium ligniniphilum]
MNEELHIIGKTIIEKKYEIVKEVIKQQEEGYKQKVKQTKIPEEQIMEYRAELIQYIGEALIHDLEVVYEKAKSWAGQIGQMGLENEMSIEDAFKVLAIYRKTIWDTIGEEIEKNQYQAMTVFNIGKRINPLLDKLNNIFSTLYVKETRKKFDTAQMALLELSVPVVPLAEGIAVLPVVGEIDTYRAKLMMQITLQQSMQLQISCLIIDVSGVSMIDTMVAQKIFEIVKALKLVGVETKLTGIRPEIAQTIVALGVNFDGIKTRASMQQALTEIGFTMN